MVCEGYGGSDIRSWRQCKLAVQAVVNSGIAKIIKGGQHPQYKLSTASDIPGCLPGSLPAALTEPEAQLVEKIRANVSFWVPKIAAHNSAWAHIGTQPWAVANNLVSKNILSNLSGQIFSLAPLPEAKDSADPIWIPNAIVDGVAGEIAPIELIRQSANKLALRLFIDLYHAQSLNDFGGVHWLQLRRKFERRKVGAQGSFVIWGFVQSNLESWRSAPFFEPHFLGKHGSAIDEQWKANWAAFEMLEVTGLIETVGHVINADNADATVMHPYALDNGEFGERAIAQAAHKAGLAMLSQWKQDGALDRSLWLLPVRKHITDVQIVGLIRAKYRARTSATAAWFSAGWDEWTERYHVAEMRALGLSVDINGSSKVING